MKSWFYILISIVFGSLFAKAEWVRSFENYFSVQGGQRTQASWNPGNHLLELPSAVGQVDLRQNLVYQTENGKWVLRSRLLAEANQVVYQSPDHSEVKTATKVDLTDAYFEGNIQKEHTYALGLQVYQWGPCEAMSPSNPLFHFRQDQRRIFYKEKGKVLARANLNWTEQINLVLIAEPMSNNETPWQFSEPFQAKALAKLEVQSPENRNTYVGIVLGTEDGRNLFLGEYANWALSQGWSLYVDGKQTRSSRHLTLFQDSLGIDYLDTNADNSQIFSIVDVGFRYEGDWDWRLEGIYNSLGYDSEGFKRAYRSVSTLNPYLSRNLPRFFKSGLELYGRGYLYFSLRVPDLGSRDDLNLSLRALSSINDGSGSVQIDFEKAMADAWVSYLEFLGSYGSKDTEMMLSSLWNVSVGLKWIL